MVSLDGVICRQSRWRHSVPHSRWRICVTMATLWQQQDGCYILHLQQYSHKLNLLYCFFIRNFVFYECKIIFHARKLPWTSRRADDEQEGQTWDGLMEWRRMQRSWEPGTGGPGPEIEMIGGGFLSRPRPCMGCAAWEWVSEFLF